jgi:Xaa-Pro dipeptidase
MGDEALKSEFAQRVTRFQLLLRKDEIDGALLVQKIDLFYLIGSDQNGLLWVPAEGEPLFLVRKSYERALQDAFIDKILPLRTLSQVPELIQEHDGRKPNRVGLEMDVLPAKTYLSFRDLFVNARMMDISPSIRSARMVKSSREISLIRKAAAMADELFQKVPEFLKQSGTETDLAIRAEAFYRSKGHPGLCRTRAFNMNNVYGHIMAGPSAAVPSDSPGPTGGSGMGPFMSHGAGLARIRPHEPILLDYASNVEGYLSDQCRIYSIGALPEKFHRPHRVMIDVQQAVAQSGMPGVRCGDLYALALDLAEKAGLSRGFMGHPLPVPFVGHGLGLELDEWPLIGKNSDHILEKGMVIALEPKFIFPGEGVVGVENTFLVTEAGMEKLNRFPDDLMVVSWCPES